MIAAGLGLATLLSFYTVRWLGQREPYGSFIRLRFRRKLTFFRLLFGDRRVPLRVKVIPLLALAYIASPIDLLPGIVVDDVAVALLAIALIIKLTPRQVVLDLIQRAQDP